MNYVNVGDDVIDYRDLAPALKEIVEGAILFVEGEEDKTMTEEEAIEWLKSEDCPYDDAERFRSLTDLKVYVDSEHDRCGGSIEYGVELVHEDYFEQYTKNYAVSDGAIDSEESWLFNFVDWEKASLQLRGDYNCISVEDHTYYFNLG